MNDLEKDGKNATTSAPVISDPTAALKGLEPFIGADGKVDTTKLGQSYLDLRKGFTDVTQKLSTLDQAYRVLAGKIEKPAGSEKPPYKPDEDVNSLLADPRGYVVKEASEGLASVASEIRVGLLELAHPELKDPEFVKGLQEFGKTLPPEIMDSIENYRVADWVLRNYKAHLKEAGAAPTEEPDGLPSGMPRLERPGGGKKVAGKHYTRAEIRGLMQNPTEYAKYADDI